jgi:hypothetical protein
LQRRAFLQRNCGAAQGARDLIVEDLIIEVLIVKRGATM